MRELADHLTAQGHTADFVSAGQNYRVRKTGRGRLGREMGALWAILRGGLRAERPDAVISATSPPCLLIVAALVAMRHRSKSAHWLLDMYPELAVALGEVKPGWISRLFEAAMGWAYRRTDLVMALDRDMVWRLKKHGVSARIAQPWLFAALMQPPPDAPPPSGEWTWVYSGNLGRAHEWETLLEVQSMLEKRGAPIRLLFQGGGPSWPLAQARSAELGLRRCEWKPYVPEEELASSLLRCNVLAVTQRPETQGLLWPSKLALVMTLRRPILWVGPTNGAIADQLLDYPHAGVFAPGQVEAVADWLESLMTKGVPTISKTFDAAAQREAALGNWTAMLAEVVK